MPAIRSQASTNPTPGENTPSAVMLTGNPLPTAVTLPVAAENLGVNTATVSGTVNPNGAAATYWFEYGTTEKVAQFTQTSHQSLSAGTNTVVVSAVLSGLVPHEVYYFRLVASTSAGTIGGRLLNFRSGGTDERGTDVILTIATTGNGSGAVTPIPQGANCGVGCYTYPLGTAVTLTAAASNGSKFADWAGACSGTTASCSLTMNTNQTVVATFDPGSAAGSSLTTATVGSGSGAVTPTPAGTGCGANCYTYASGTNVTLTPTVGVGSTFAGWSGACSGLGTCSVIMNASKSVTATVNLSTVNLTTSYTGSGNGAIAPSPVGTSCGTGCYSYPWGTVVSFGATPAVGTVFAGWGGACSGAGACRVMMNSPQSVSAGFSAVPLLTITTSSLPNGTLNTAYAQTISISGGLSPYTFSVMTGFLPAGLTLNSSTGAISGTPTNAAVWSFTVQVKDVSRQTAQAALTITIITGPLTITTTSLPGGTQNTSYSQTRLAQGGLPPYTFNLTSGSLPSGLTLITSNNQGMVQVSRVPPGHLHSPFRLAIPQFRRYRPSKPTRSR